MRDADRQLYFGDFERDGEEAVKANLAAARYSVRRAHMARLWLEDRADARSDASQSEQISIARSAKDAAWAAAEEARNANTTAKIAATIAAMALIIAIAALGWQIFGPHQP